MCAERRFGFLAKTPFADGLAATVNWYQNTNQHPMITGNMYRLMNGRFEQLGQCWCKHGFGSDAAGVLTFHHRLLFGTDPTDDLERRAAGLDGLRVIGMLLASPEGQLG